MACKISETDLPAEKLRYAAERIAQHENKSYENFSLFLTLSTAIVGGLGYLAISTDRNASDFWKVQKVAWNLWMLEAFIAWFFAWMIALEYFAIRRQWRDQVNLGFKASPVPGWHILKHVQLYFVLAMVLLPFLLRAFLMRPLFG